ncbi:MAG: universal stress protein [Thermomicrobiales bacterium]
MAAQPPRYRLILLPVVDASEGPEAAGHAAALGRATGATVAILGVIDTSAGFQFSAEGLARYDRLRNETQAVIEAASAIVRGAGVARVEHLIMDGIPREAIIEVADEQGADLIVLGAGRAMLDDTSPESLVTYMLRHARCPVVIVPAERKSP